MRYFLKGGILLVAALIMGCDEQSMQDLEQKANNTLQDAIKDSGLKESIEAQTQKLNDYGAKAQEFLQQKSQQLGEVLESKETKEFIQNQLESINELIKPDKN